MLKAPELRSAPQRTSSSQSLVETKPTLFGPASCFAPSSFQFCRDAPEFSRDLPEGRRTRQQQGTLRPEGNIPGTSRKDLDRDLGHHCLSVLRLALQVC